MSRSAFQQVLCERPTVVFCPKRRRNDFDDVLQQRVQQFWSRFPSRLTPRSRPALPTRPSSPPTKFRRSAVAPTTTPSPPVPPTQRLGRIRRPQHFPRRPDRSAGLRRRRTSASRTGPPCRLMARRRLRPDALRREGPPDDAHADLRPPSRSHPRPSPDLQPGPNFPPSATPVRQETHSRRGKRKFGVGQISHPWCRSWRLLFRRWERFWPIH